MVLLFFFGSDGAAGHSEQPPDWSASKLYVYSVVTKTHPHTQALEQTARAYGYNVTLLTLETEFVNLTAKLEFEKSISCGHEATDVILFVDAYDVLFVKEERVFMQQLALMVKHRSHFVVFNAERNCWPDSFRNALYPVVPSPWKFLNSGVLVATAGYMCRLMHYQNIQAVDMERDQRFWTTVYLEEYMKGGMLLDTGCTLFQTMVLLQDGDVVYLPQHGWLNTVTQSFPSIMHGNGDVGRYLRQIVAPTLPIEYQDLGGV